MSKSIIIGCPNCNKLNRIPEEKLQANGSCGSCKNELFLDKPIELNQANFNTHVFKSEIPVLVDFWATWCGPCKMMAPVMEEAATSFGHQIRIAKVNTEEQQALASQYNIRSIPTLAIFLRGKEIDRVSGAMNLQQLKNWSDTTISKLK